MGEEARTRAGSRAKGLREGTALTGREPLVGIDLSARAHLRPGTEPCPLGDITYLGTGELVIVVTGAASGIGAATALEFASSGAHIIGCDLPDSDLSLVSEAVECAGGTLFPCTVDAGIPRPCSIWRGM